MDFWRNLFNTDDFPARWYCGQWTDGHGWLHIYSDLAIWSAYFAIPCALGYLMIQRKEFPFRRILLLFGAFILLCGTTHLMEAVIFWWPAYRLAGVIKFMTAAVSWLTVFALIEIAPRALAMRSPEELEQEIAARRVAENALQLSNTQLEQRVKQRTAELITANESLQNEVAERRLAESRLQESESRFRQLADAMPQIVWVADRDGRCEYFNQRWYEYVGQTPKESTGQGWVSRLHPHDEHDALDRWNQALENQEPYEMEHRLRTQGGNYRWFLSRAMLMRNETGSLDHWFGTCTDIQDLKGLHEELRQVAARLSEVDKRKDEFLATLAHELRNPLAPIRSGLEVMKVIKDDPITLEEVRETMERQTRQLITLVDDLLDVSRITCGKFELKVCRMLLSDCIKTAIESASSLIHDAAHQLTVRIPDEPIFLEADPNRLAQVLSNLLNNAAKYTPRGGQITLEATVQAEECCISVKDNGIGIPSNKLNVIFEMFTQLEYSKERMLTGLGVGLSIVKSLVQMHGGRIEVVSEGLNRGSDFRVYLPYQSKARELRASSADGGVQGEGKKYRILVVDDNLDAARMLSHLIKAFGNEVRMSPDGQDAVGVAATFQPDVILMDLGMPRMNGYEAARYIRQQPWGQQMYLVALTGWGQEVDRQRSKEAGFDHHLVKPADPGDVQRLLASL